MINSFRQYLDEQPQFRKREIIKAERTYLDLHRVRMAENPAERDYTESFEGYEDPPAGKTGI